MVYLLWSVSEPAVSPVMVLAGDTEVASVAVASAAGATGATSGTVYPLATTGGGRFRVAPTGIGFLNTGSKASFCE